MGLKLSLSSLSVILLRATGFNEHKSTTTTPDGGGTATGEEINNTTIKLHLFEVLEQEIYHCVYELF